MKIPLNHKYRPNQIADIACQPILTKIINNAIILNCLSSAYLFSGMRGVGKTSTARVIARTINCQNKKIIDNNAFSCGECKNCSSYIAGSHPDIIEIDAASNTGVDNIRTVIEDAIYKPILGKYKVYIIDEVHMLSKNAFNAFLKILEEPPLSTIFILATTEPSKVLATISSRCQRFELDRVDIKQMSEYLAKICNLEELQYTDDALIAIAKNSEGSIRDAISLLDKASAFIGLEKQISQELILKITGSGSFSTYTDLMYNILIADTKRALEVVGQLYSSNVSIVTVLQNLLEIISNIAKAKVIDGYSKDMSFSDLYNNLFDASFQYNVPTLIICWQILFNRVQQMQYSFTSGLLHIEMVIIELICALKISQGQDISIDNKSNLDKGAKNNLQNPITSQLEQNGQKAAEIINTQNSTSKNKDTQSDVQGTNAKQGDNVQNTTEINNSQNFILNNKHLVKILKILQAHRLYEVYYYLMNDVQVLYADETSISILAEKEDENMTRKLSNTMNNYSLDATFTVQVQRGSLDKSYNITNQLIANCKNSAKWNIIKTQFPNASVKDILYQKDDEARA